MDDKHLDEFIRKRVSNAEVSPPPSVWDNIEASQRPSRKPYLYLAAGIAALLMALPFVLRNESPVYEPRQTVMTPLEEEDYTSPFVAIADDMARDDVEEKPVVQSTAIPSRQSSTQKSDIAFAGQADAAMAYLDSLEQSIYRTNELRDIDRMAVEIVEQKIKRMEMEAMLENAWQNRENMAMEGNRSNNLLPTIRKFFHPDYYLAVDLDNLPKVRLPERNASDK
jgi:hypothetical protein